MPSISTMGDLIGALDSNVITVHQDRCALVRNRNANCLKCAEVCTSECIVFDGEELKINADNCIGCGTCCTACPTCALEAHNPNDAQLMNTARAAGAACGGKVVIACGEALEAAGGAADASKIARVECLGRVEEALLTSLIAAGATEIELAHGNCATCPHVTGRAMVEKVLECEATILEAWGREMPVHLVDALPDYVLGGEGSAEPAPAAASATATAPATAEHHAQPHTMRVMADGTLPHFIPDRRERLLDALASLGEPEDVKINTRLWGHVTIDTEKCLSCRMCAVFCPTGALRKFDREDGTFGVEHYPGDCVKCNSCESICFAQTLKISDEVYARDMLRGKTDEYEMKPMAVQVSQAHTIWNKYKNFANIKEIYER